jgi:hypothetical protein
VVLAASVSSVLLGTGTALLGVLVGGLLERWRDDTKWQRDEAMRWAADLRVVYRDLLWKGDLFWRLSDVHIGQIDQLENAPSESKQSAAKALMDKMLEMSAVYDDVSAAVADVDLIGSDAEAQAAERYGASVTGLSFSDTTVQGWRETAEREYHEARDELVSHARTALRQARAVRRRARVDRST